MVTFGDPRSMSLLYPHQVMIMILMADLCNTFEHFNSHFHFAITPVVQNLSGLKEDGLSGYSLP
jgi:hypothetical protein